jgi:hypothetical protein
VCRRRTRIGLKKRVSRKGFAKDAKGLLWWDGINGPIRPICFLRQTSSIAKGDSSHDEVIAELSPGTCKAFAAQNRLLRYKALLQKIAKITETGLAKDRLTWRRFL